MGEYSRREGPGGGMSRKRMSSRRRKMGFFVCKLTHVLFRISFCLVGRTTKRMVTTEHVAHDNQAINAVERKAHRQNEKRVSFFLGGRGWSNIWSLHVPSFFSLVVERNAF